MNTLERIRQKFDLDLSKPSPIEIPNFGRDGLAELFAELGFQAGVEIGVERGLYSEVLCRANPKLHLFCVDPWERYGSYRDHVSQEKLDSFYADAEKRLSPYAATLVRRFSMEEVKFHPHNSLDFVYIDGNHSFEYVVADVIEWEKRVRPGGILAGHDYIRRNNDISHHVVQAVSAYAECYKIHPWFLAGRRAKRDGEIRDKNRSWFWVKK